MPKPSRNQIYDAVIRRMVNEALEVQEQAFAREHGEDSDEVLLAVLTGAASALGHSPWPGEFAGGGVIARRFGSWEEALTRAGLGMPALPNKMESFLRVQEENQRQKRIYRQNKEEKRRKAQERLQSQAEKRRENKGL